MTGDRERMGLALGRIPSGLFVASCGQGDASVPFLASWVQQCDLDPPAVSVAIRKDRPALGALDAQGGLLTISVLPEGRADLMKPFFRDDGPDPFGGLETGTGPGGGRYLAEALAWIECRVSGRIEAGAHVLVVAEVLAGDLLTTTDGPAVHLRKTGFSY